MENNFLKLSKINVNENIEKVKSGNRELSFLSWSYAWREFKTIYPKGYYKVGRDEKGLPYFGEEDIGYMVFINVNNGEGEEHEMWLPVMDSLFNSLKKKEYDYTTRFGTKHVEAMTMFDVNKSLMRALAKAIAMFGLGLYIYAGEDIPKAEKDEIEAEKEKAKKEEENKKVKDAIEKTLELAKKKNLACEENKIKIGNNIFDLTGMNIMEIRKVYAKIDEIKGE